MCIFGFWLGCVSPMFEIELESCVYSYAQKFKQIEVITQFLVFDTRAK